MVVNFRTHKISRNTVKKKYWTLIQNNFQYEHEKKKIGHVQLSFKTWRIGTLKIDLKNDEVGLVDVTLQGIKKNRHYKLMFVACVKINLACYLGPRKYFVV
jgi:hypothetical protein